MLDGRALKGIGFLSACDEFLNPRNERIRRKDGRSTGTVEKGVPVNLNLTKTNAESA
jgi:hypothetical protein